MSEKGFINPGTPILADNPTQPYIMGDGGITDTVSAHIADIVEDRAPDIFARSATQNAISGTARLISDITFDGRTREIGLAGLNCANYFVVYETVVAGTVNVNTQVNGASKGNHTAYGNAGNFSIEYLQRIGQYGAMCETASVGSRGALNIHTNTVANVDLSDGINELLFVFDAAPASGNKMKVWCM